MKVLIIDNYDSFTYNLYQLIGSLGVQVEVFRNDEIDVAGVRAQSPSHVVLSPGPGRPDRAGDFGVCAGLIDGLGPDAPLLGVCLGHQGIVQHFGGHIVRAPEIVHGKTSLIHHDGEGLFAGLPKPLDVMRYHSLVAAAETMPDCLQVSARTEDGLIMAVRHRTRAISGVQFHPESVGTPAGDQLMRNFLQIEG